MAASQRRSMRLRESTNGVLSDRSSLDSMYIPLGSRSSKSRSAIDTSRQVEHSSPHDDEDESYGSGASESCSSSEVGPPSIHRDSRAVRGARMTSASPLAACHGLLKTTMHQYDDSLSRLTGSRYQDFQMSVSYESIEGWTTTTSGSSTKTNSHPERQAGRRRSTVGWKAGTNDASYSTRWTDQGSPIVSRTRSGRIVKPITRSESMPSLKKRRTLSDAANCKPRRATTPPVPSNISRSGPERPQSAMKHKSANRYSQGKDEAIILDTSIDIMPHASPERSPFLTTIPLSSRSSTLAKPTPKIDEDPDAFSPAQSRSRQSLPLFVLRSRASLPKHDFYERHKREEGSPTPEIRKLGTA